VTTATPKLVSLADHPRAAPAIRRARAWGGLAGFVLIGLAGLLAGLPIEDVLLRALAGGVGGHLALWLASILLWRHVLRAEALQAARRARERASRGEPAP